jgi:hypothetical protein
MLSCFAQTGDLRAANEGVQGCATAARNLHACMAKPQKSTASKNQSVGVDRGIDTCRVSRMLTPHQDQLPPLAHEEVKDYTTLYASTTHLERGIPVARVEARFVKVSRALGVSLRSTH